MKKIRDEQIAIEDLQGEIYHLEMQRPEFHEGLSTYQRTSVATSAPETVRRLTASLSNIRGSVQ